MRLGSEGDDLSNVEDRRGLIGGGMKLGLGGILILGALSLIFRQNLFTAVDQTGAQPQSAVMAPLTSLRPRSVMPPPVRRRAWPAAPGAGRQR